MLFDLRSRHRRRAVQVTYLVLAVLMGGGLVLFGVGTGTGGGGLLNAFGGGGSGNGQVQAVSQQEKAALKQIKLNPNDAQAWGNLLQARWATANSGNNVTTSGYTSSGVTELQKAAQAWGQYSRLSTTPDPALATLAARAYVGLGNYAGAASAWEIEAAATPTEVKGYECLAATAYAAGETRKGDLAAAKAVQLVPKSSQVGTKLQLAQARNSSTAARNLAAGC